MTNYKDRLRLVLGLLEKDKLTNEEKDALYARALDTGLRARKHKIKRLVFQVAASIALFVGVGIYFKSQNNDVKTLDQNTWTASALKSEGYGAILTLADGSKIDLAKRSTDLNRTDNNNIILSSDSMLLYKKPDNTAITDNHMNTLEVPKKYTFKVILADGTKVWLNSDSKLHYPTHFVGNERKVDLSGEAYFEVAPNKQKPFIVQTDRQQIQVLGTHFNVQSYPNKPVVTSLLEGMVAVNALASNKTKVLLPGDQSRTSSVGDIDVKHMDNITDYIAWKDGYFQLNATPIAEIMDLLSRWYDFEYSTVGIKKSNIKLYGKIHKSATLDQALQILSQFDIDYNINKNNAGLIQITLKPSK
ncbi:FecR family protein [Sphingobacterium faecale]|uniref:FecR family protein n=1 Tax=Sphingobacterium faecale TaxID=2803775 RepID=A0ABS1R8S7_9SPHI|nr:FecR family protein [Sphingobacterium faecale]MBL1410392.1 FecR family protein [Sphingobacterium faecale]